MKYWNPDCQKQYYGFHFVYQLTGTLVFLQSIYMDKLHLKPHQGEKDELAIYFLGGPESNLARASCTYRTYLSFISVAYSRNAVLFFSTRDGSSYM